MVIFTFVPDIELCDNIPDGWDRDNPQHWILHVFV